MNVNEFIENLLETEKDNKHMITSVELGVKKFESYKEIFGLTVEQTMELIRKNVRLLAKNPNMINEKIEFYKNHFNMDYKEIKDLLVKVSALVISSNESIEAKTEYFKNVLDLNNNEIAKLLKTYPKLFTLDIEMLHFKVDFYKNALKLNDEEVVKFIKSSPGLLNRDVISNEPTSIKSKMIFYKKILKMNDEELRTIIRRNPSFLHYDIISENSTSVKSKMNFYKTTLELSDDQLIEMIKKNPHLLQYDVLSTDDSSAQSKLKYLKSIGVTKEQLVSNPTLLAHPAKRVRFRYMILAQVVNDEDIFKSKNLMISEKKLYARLKYLQSRSDVKDIRMSFLGYAEQSFVKQYGITSEELLEKYKLDENAIEDVVTTYNNSHKRKITLNDEETIELLR